jgi:hypothetical protein
MRPSMRASVLSASAPRIFNRARFFDGGLHLTTRGRSGRASWTKEPVSAP